MADKIKVVLDKDGVGALLKGQEVKDMVSSMAGNVKNNTGQDYEVITKKMSTRQVGIVQTTTEKALQDNLDNNTLLKALGNLPGRPKK